MGLNVPVTGHFIIMSQLVLTTTSLVYLLRLLKKQLFIQTVTNYRFKCVYSISIYIKTAFCTLHLHQGN